MVKVQRRIDKLEREIMLPAATSLLRGGVFVVTAEECDMVPSTMGGRGMNELSKPARGVVIIVHGAPK